MPSAKPRDLFGLVAANREAIDVFVDVARNIDPDRWGTPVEGGGWSPAQLTDHVTRAYDFGSAVIAGTVTRPLPAPLRWMLGKFWFRPVIRNGKFSGKVKAPKPFVPAQDPGPPDELLPRLRAASERFAAAVERNLRSGSESVLHPMFGTIPLLDFLELQVIHVAHHRAQLPKVPS